MWIWKCIPSWTQPHPAIHYIKAGLALHCLGYFENWWQMYDNVIHSLWIEASVFLSRFDILLHVWCLVFLWDLSLSVTLLPHYVCSVVMEKQIVSSPYRVITIRSLILAGLTSVSHVKNRTLENSGLLMLYSLGSLRFYSVGCISSALRGRFRTGGSYFSAGVLGLPPWLDHPGAFKPEGQDFRVENPVFHSHKWPTSDSFGLMCLCRLSFLQLRLEWVVRVICKTCFSAQLVYLFGCRRCYLHFHLLTRRGRTSISVRVEMNGLWNRQ